MLPPSSGHNRPTVAHMRRGLPFLFHHCQAALQTEKVIWLNNSAAVKNL